MIGRVMGEPFAGEGLPLDDARSRILAALEPCLDQEVVPLVKGLGRVSAQPVVSQAEVPGFRASMMAMPLQAMPFRPSVSIGR